MARLHEYLSMKVDVLHASNVKLAQHVLCFQPVVTVHGVAPRRFRLFLLRPSFGHERKQFVEHPRWGQVLAVYSSGHFDAEFILG